MNMNIQDKVIVITGASSGIGKAAAKLLAAQGAKLVLVARNQNKLEQAVKEIRANKGVAEYFIADVSNAGKMQELTEFTLNTFGQIDVLVNNAGYMPGSFLYKNQIEEWNKTIDINIKAVLYGIGAVLPHMHQRGEGQIINVSSSAAYEKAIPGASVYFGSKAAVRSITDGLRAEESMMKSNIRVVQIAPGAVDTDLKYDVTDSELSGFIQDMYANHPTLQPEEMAQAIVYAINQPQNIVISDIIVKPVNAS
ncbi:MAG: SDR family oxidoreductase [Alphaproteobacteria bacterium]